MQRQMCTDSLQTSQLLPFYSRQQDSGRSRRLLLITAASRNVAIRCQPLASSEMAATGLPLKSDLLTAVYGICHCSCILLHQQSVSLAIENWSQKFNNRLYVFKIGYGFEIGLPAYLFTA